MYALASFGFGFRRSKTSRNDKTILCIRQNHVLVEFFLTKPFGGRIMRYSEAGKFLEEVISSPHHPSVDDR